MPKGHPLKAHSFKKSIGRQVNIVFALVVREMTTRYGNKIGGYMWAVLDPVLTVAILTFVFSAIAHSPPLGRSFPLFFATGYFTFYMYRSTADQVCTSVEANRALLSYPIVNPIDTIISRILLQVITLFVVAVLLFGYLSFQTKFEQINLGPIIVASLLAILLGAGVGICNIVWFHLSPLYHQIWGIINRPAFLVSGVFFLPETMPHPFRDLILWNPLVHVIGLFRAGFYPTYRAAYVDIPFVLGITVFSLSFGMFLVWLFEAQLREAQ